MRRSTLAATVAAASLTLFVRGAEASPPARLVYSRSQGAQSCPDEMALRAAVAARIGHDPFLPWARRTVVAQIAGEAHAFVGSVDLIDENGTSHGARQLRTRGACAELLDAIALAIAIAIDPQTLVSSPPPPATAAPEPEPETVSTPDPPRAPEPVPAPEREPPPTPPGPVPQSTVPQSTTALRLEAEAGLVASTGASPAPIAAGLSLGAVLRGGRLSAGLEGRVDAPSSGKLGGGTLTSWLVAGALVPCWHVGALMACGIGQVGSLEASGSNAGSGQAWWVAAGGRMGATASLGRSVGLRVHGDVLGNLSRVTWEIGGHAWTAPPVAVAVGSDAVVLF